MPDQAGGSTCIVHQEDVEDGEVDALVKSLVADASANGIVDHFRGKGAKKGFRAHFLHMWDRVRGLAPALVTLPVGYVACWMPGAGARGQ